MKNEVIDALMTRRSCRSYTDEMPAIEELQTILEAGLYAPSGKNRQTSMMVCVTDKETRDLLSKLNAQALPTGSENTDPFFGAPAVIAVLGDSSSHLYIQDASLVMENMLLAAHALKLGSCWINRGLEVFNSLEGKKLKEKWNIPENYEGIAFCIVGHPAAALPEPQPRKDGRVIFVNQL